MSKKGCSVEISEKQLVPKFTIAVLVSGEGTNLQAIIDQLHRRSVDPAYSHMEADDLIQERIKLIEIALVVTDKVGCPSVARAWGAGIPTAVIPFDKYDDAQAHDDHMAAAMRDVDAELVVLAGYMRKLAPSFVEEFAGRLINVHPSLLPAFPGTNAVAEALEYGVKTTGVTVHYVEEEVDHGPVIAQEAVAVEDGDTVDCLLERIHEVEHRLLPGVIRGIAADKITPPAKGSRWVKVQD